MPPTSAVPPLRTLRRVSVVMHSSLDVSELMPFGQSYAGLESLSVYRASVVQRMRTLSPAQYVGSMIICWCSTCSAVVASSPRNRENSSQSSGAITSFPIVTAIRPAAWIVSALQPAHEPYRHNGPSRAATVLPWPSGFSPSYMKFGTGSWRNVIVVPRSRKSSASFEAPAMVSLRELAGHQKYRTCYVRRFI